MIQWTLVIKKTDYPDLTKLIYLGAISLLQEQNVDITFTLYIMGPHLPYPVADLYCIGASTHNVGCSPPPIAAISR